MRFVLHPSNTNAKIWGCFSTPKHPPVYDLDLKVSVIIRSFQTVLITKIDQHHMYDIGMVKKYANKVGMIKT